MDEKRDQQMQSAISNMISDLERQIKKPLTEKQLREIFSTIHHCLVHLAENKQNIAEHR